MGIDAVMVVRNVKRQVVTDEWLTDMSWQLAESIGANKFWFFDDRPILHRSCRYAGDDGEAIYDGKEAWGLGAQEDECLLEIDVTTRYYGPGYTRGDILTLCAVAEWCETNLPSAEIYYGSDCDIVINLFDEDRRKNLRALLYSPRGRDFYNYPDSSPYFVESCSRCPGSRYQGNRHGWEAGYANYYCPGCGRRSTTNDGGVTWEHSNEGDE